MTVTHETLPLFFKIVYFFTPNENESKNTFNNTSFLLFIQSICILKLGELRNMKWETD